MYEFVGSSSVYRSGYIVVVVDISLKAYKMVRDALRVTVNDRSIYWEM